jgi:AcrR family transcriptional regulator
LSASAATSLRGRPRERRVDDALRQATRELLAEVGYAALSVEGVAARAGVGKAAVYRRFRSKAELVFASAVHGPDLPPPRDTGTLRGDLAVLAEGILGSLTTPVSAEAVPGLLADLAKQPEIARRFQATFIQHEQVRVETILERARSRGELRESPDPALVHALLLGPLFAWLFLLRRPPARDLGERLADLAARALGPVGPPPPRTGPRTAKKR